MMHFTLMFSTDKKDLAKTRFSVKIGETDNQTDELILLDNSS